MRLITAFILCFVLTGCSDTKAVSKAINDFQKDCVSAKGTLSSEFYYGSFSAGIKISCENHQPIIAEEGRK